MLHCQDAFEVSGSAVFFGVLPDSSFVTFRVIYDDFGEGSWQCGWEDRAGDVVIGDDPVLGWGFTFEEAESCYSDIVVSELWTENSCPNQ
jgi:hypothetical protein